MKKKAKGKAVSKRTRKEQPKSAKASSTKVSASSGLVSADIRKAYKNRLISEYFQRQV